MSVSIVDAATRTAFAAAAFQQTQCEAVIAPWAGGNVTARVLGTGGALRQTVTLGPWTIAPTTPREVRHGARLAYTTVSTGDIQLIEYRTPGGALIFTASAGEGATAAAVDFTGPIRSLCGITLTGAVFTANAALPLFGVPSYVPATVGEAALITTTNSLQSVRPALPWIGQAIGLADFSGGAFNRWAGGYGKHLIHGGGHSANDDASIYAVAYGPTSVSWELLLGMYDLRNDGTWIVYGGGAFGGLNNSIQYFIWRGPGSTLPNDPLNPAGWAVADDVTVNRREYKEGWPGSAHTYDTLRIIPPSLGGGAQGSLLRHGAFAVGATVSMDTFWAHRFELGATSWTRYPQIIDSFARSSSLDTTRGRVLPFGTRSYRDLATGNFVSVGGSVTGLPTGYADNLLMEYHDTRDVHVVIRNTQEESTAGTPSKWAWIAGASTTSGAWTTVTWAGGTAPPNMALSGQTAQASCVYIDALDRYCYYTRADVDAYYLVEVPANPANPWSWVRVPITGAGRPSLLSQPGAHVYRRFDWAPALKSISFVPWTRDTGATINQVILIRVAP